MLVNTAASWERHTVKQQGPIAPTPPMFLKIKCFFLGVSSTSLSYKTPFK